MAPGSEALLITFLQESVNSVALTPDGRWMFSGSDDTGVHFWDPNTGTAHTAHFILRGHNGPGKVVIFSQAADIAKNYVGVM